MTYAGGEPILPNDAWATLAAPRRLAIVRSLASLGTDADADFDRLTRLAATACAAPVAFIALADLDRQYFKARHGIESGQLPTNSSFCIHGVITPERVMVVNDAAADTRFRDDPLVAGDCRIRFCAGAPIEVEGVRVGVLCVLDREVRPALVREQEDALLELAGLASSLFALKEGMRSGALTRQALAREEKRRAIALEAASLSSWIWDVQSGRVECDESLPVMFGLPPAGFMPARSFFRAIDPRDARRTSQAFRDALASRDDYFGEYRVRNVTPTRWLAARGSVVERSPDGRPLLVFGVNYDISSTKETEERQRLLLRELNHRVKNTLAVVQAMAHQTFRSAGVAREPRQAFENRLMALAAAHNLLTASNWENAALADIARDTLNAGGVLMSRAEYAGPRVLLPPREALALAMALHELTTNAVKYGALSNDKGRVSLGWSRSEDAAGAPALTIRWRESEGPPVETPARRGFGSVLLERSLQEDLGGKVDLDFRPDGLTCSIVLPWPR